MNAPATFPLGQQALTLEQQAYAILAGSFPRFDDALFECADWLSAADELLHESNPVELAFMLAREEAHEAFVAWQRRDERQREFADFGTWLADKADACGDESVFARGMTNDERRVAA